MDIRRFLKPKEFPKVLTTKCFKPQELQSAGSAAASKTNEIEHLDVSENCEIFATNTVIQEVRQTSSESSKSAQCSSNSISIKIDLGDKNNGPAQPNLNKYPISKFGNRERSFSKCWFKKFLFIEYSLQKDAVFCFACINFNTGESNEERTFTQIGLRNWKKIGIKLRKHSLFDSHVAAMEKWMTYNSSKTNGNVLNKLTAGNFEVVQENKKYIEKIILTIIYLCTQGLAFRGHDESHMSQNQGNFRELCLLLAKFDDKFSNKLSCSSNMTSPDIQNEFIHIIGD